jgi:peroxiredoxin
VLTDKKENREMTQTGVFRPVQPGERAPRFSLPAVHREGVVSLDDYLDRSPLLLAVFRGLHCPFCRRTIAELGGIAERLKAVGVETLAVVATNADHARLYFKHRPARVALAADAERGTHRAYGVPSVPMTPQLLEAIQTTPVNPTGDLPRPMPLPEIGAELDRREGFQASETDRLDQERQLGQLHAQFLVDRTGVVRWVNVEGATEGLAGFGKFPTADELLRAARSVL